MGKYIKNSQEFINEGIVIDGLEYPISEEKYKWVDSASSRFVYVNNNSENYYDRSNIRVYNPTTKEHYYLQSVYAEIGDEGLVFVDFPRTDGPVDGRESATQYTFIRTWNRTGAQCEFVRYKIEEYSTNDEDMCKVSDGYNYGTHGWYSRGSFYKVVNIAKGS